VTDEDTARGAPAPLPPDRLSVRVDPGLLGFASTDEADPPEGLVGQERALDAISFGASIGGDGYNVFAMGPPGSGRRRALRRILSERAAEAEPPDDWVYVNNFDAQHRPAALRLPPGKAVAFRDAMSALIEDLALGLPAAFETEEYKNARSAIESEHQSAHEDRMAEIREKANEAGVAIMRTPMGFAFAPMKDGEVVKPDEFKQWPEEDQQRVQETVEELQKELNELLSRDVPSMEKEMRQAIRELDRETAKSTIEVAVADVAAKFPGIDRIQEHLQAVSDDLVDNFHLFIELAKQGENVPMATKLEHPALRRYSVNVLDARPAGGDGERHGAPMVEEAEPTHANLVGRIEHQPHQGALITDFTLIKAGALHRANGGYLIVEARDLLMQPFAWEGLKRCLKTGEIKISSLAERFSLMSTVSLEPDAIPLRVRIALVGDRLLYYLLSMLDPDFPRLFKVQADFEDDIDRSEENLALLGRMAAGIARREEVGPFDAGAVARLLEEASRIADDAAKLTLRLEPLTDLMREAAHVAGDTRPVTAGHVDRAVAERRRRAGRLREKSVEVVDRGLVTIDTEGAVAGQVNGLAVVSLGETRFGKPSRISARTRVGRGKIIDIEREVELGGPLHSKGVLILSSFLASRYGGDSPVSLSASLVFEQSYGGVEGDSASSAELYALLSALSGCPIRQRFAVTGSVDQFGRVQAIGGVNEKIEGFFDVCSAKGLTGDQGVLIPEANVQHLNLRADVVEAVEAGRFGVYPVAQVDEGIALLTGVEAGAPGPDGSFPAGSVNARVAATLEDYAEAMLAYARRAGPGAAAAAGGGDERGDGESGP
jgi:predicted ATP-dependent protease